MSYKRFAVFFVLFLILTFLPDIYRFFLYLFNNISIDWNKSNLYKTNFNLLYDFGQTGAITLLFYIYKKNTGKWLKYIVACISLFVIQTLIIRYFPYWYIFRPIEFSRDIIQIILAYLIFKKIKYTRGEYRYKLLWFLFLLILIFNFFLIIVNKLPISIHHDPINKIIMLQFIYIIIILITYKYFKFKKLKPINECNICNDYIYKVVCRPINLWTLCISFFLDGMGHAIMLVEEDKITFYEFYRETGKLEEVNIENFNQIKDYLISDSRYATQTVKDDLKTSVGTPYGALFSCVTFGGRFFVPQKNK